MEQQPISYPQFEREVSHKFSQDFREQCDAMGNTSIGADASVMMCNYMLAKVTEVAGFTNPHTREAYLEHFINEAQRSADAWKSVTVGEQPEITREAIEELGNGALDIADEALKARGIGQNVPWTERVSTGESQGQERL